MPTCCAGPPSSPPDHAFLLSLIELRSIMEPAAARLAASRATPAQILADRGRVPGHGGFAAARPRGLPPPRPRVPPLDLRRLRQRHAAPLLRRDRRAAADAVPRQHRRRASPTRTRSPSTARSPSRSAAASRRRPRRRCTSCSAARCATSNPLSHPNDVLEEGSHEARVAASAAAWRWHSTAHAQTKKLLRIHTAGPERHQRRQHQARGRVPGPRQRRAEHASRSRCSRRASSARRAR